MTGEQKVGWAIFTVVAVAVAGWWGLQQISCTVGIAGTTASLTVDGGLGASGECDTLVRTTTNQSAYRGDANTAVGSLACRYRIRGLTYTVKDTGMMLVGSAMCDTLRLDAQGASP